MGWFHRLLGCGIEAGVCLLVCEAGPKARAGSLVGGTRDPGAGACPLVGRVGNQGLWLEGPGGPGSSSCALVCGAWSWRF